MSTQSSKTKWPDRTQAYFEKYPKAVFRTYKVFSVLAQYADKKSGWAFPGKERISEIAGLSFQVVSNEIRTLEKMGAISPDTIKGRQGGEQRGWWITTVDPAPSGISQDEQEPAQVEPSQVEEDDSYTDSEGVPLLAPSSRGHFKPPQPVKTPKAQAPVAEPPRQQARVEVAPTIDPQVVAELASLEAQLLSELTSRKLKMDNLPDDLFMRLFGKTNQTSRQDYKEAIAWVCSQVDRSQPDPQDYMEAPDVS